MVRAIGTAARKELERDLEAHVFLDLQVRVREHSRPRSARFSVGPPARS
jgi:GTPase Era involved in 16S rRNA processing